jgi:tetratricopeptide (TPR) repeat protein
VLLAVAGLFVFTILLASYALLDSPRPVDDRVFRGRSLLDTENYLSAVEVLREVPIGGANSPEARAYLGAAYLRLHLYQAAIREFEAVIRQGPGLLDGWLGLAATHLQLGDAQQALEPATEATEIEPRSTDAWIILGRVHWMQRSFGDAEKVGLKALELDPDNPIAAELLLHIYADQNLPDKFEPLLERQKNPLKAIRDLAADFYARQGQLVRAWDYRSRYDKRPTERRLFENELALKREPSRTALIPIMVRDLVALGRAAQGIETAMRYSGPVALDLELGKAYLQTGQNAEAMTALSRASAARLHKLSAEVLMAAMTHDVGHWREAFQAERIEKDYFVLSRLEDVLKTGSPIEKMYAHRYAGVYDTRFYNEAADDALSILNEQPDDYDALMTIATAYQRLGRIDDALRYVEHARQTYPDRGEPWSRMGSLSISKGDAPKALEYMARAVQLEPSDASDLYNLGWIYDQTGDTQRATTYYERAIQASPLSFEAMNNLALVYQATGQAERARQLLENATGVDPENEAVYLNLADYYVRQSASKEAIANYSRAAQVNPANPIAPVEMGKIYLEKGDTELALDKLNQALDIDPNSFDAYLALSSTYEKLGRPKEAAAAIEEARRIRPDAPELGKESKE